MSLNAIVIACAFASSSSIISTSSLWAQTTRPSRSQKQVAIREAISMLEQEARQSMRDQKLAASRADFNTRFEHDIPAGEVLEALTRPAHADPFIDSYVRWQFTSFDPELPVLDDRQFLKLLSNMPAMVSNPGAEEDVVATFQNAEKSVRLSTADLQRLRGVARELDRRTAIAESFNRPGLEYRTWLADKTAEANSPAGRARQLQWLIEECAATIAAGWPSRDIKARMTKEFKADANRAITPIHRAAIEQQLGRLAGLKRVAIKDIAFLADGSIDVSLTRAEIDQQDVRKWTALLNGGTSN